jgi:hypothetical protein
VSDFRAKQVFVAFFVAADSEMQDKARISKFSVRLDYQHPNDISKNRCDHSPQSGETTVNQQTHFCCNNPKLRREQFLVCSMFWSLSQFPGIFSSLDKQVGAPTVPSAFIANSGE